MHRVTGLSRRPRQVLRRRLRVRGKRLLRPRQLLSPLDLSDLQIRAWLPPRLAWEGRLFELMDSNPPWLAECAPATSLQRVRAWEKGRRVVQARTAEGHLESPEQVSALSVATYLEKLRDPNGLFACPHESNPELETAGVLREIALLPKSYREALVGVLDLSPTLGFLRARYQSEIAKQSEPQDARWTLGFLQIFEALALLGENLASPPSPSQSQLGLDPRAWLHWGRGNRALGRVVEAQQAAMELRKLAREGPQGIFWPMPGLFRDPSTEGEMHRSVVEFLSSLVDLGGDSRLSPEIERTLHQALAFELSPDGRRNGWLPDASDLDRLPSTPRSPSTTQEARLEIRSPGGTPSWGKLEGASRSSVWKRGTHAQDPIPEEVSLRLEGASEAVVELVGQGTGSEALPESREREAFGVTSRIEAGKIDGVEVRPWKRVVTVEIPESPEPFEVQIPLSPAFSVRSDEVQAKKPGGADSFGESFKQDLEIDPDLLLIRWSRPQAGLYRIEIPLHPRRPGAYGFGPVLAQSLEAPSRVGRAPGHRVEVEPR